MSLTPMKNIKKLFLTLITSTLLFSGTSFVLENTNVAHAADDICSSITSGFITCSTDELSFTKYTGELTKISPEGYDTGITRVGSVREFIQKVVNYALSFLGLIAVLLIIYAGIMLVTAAGKTEQAEKAKKTMGYTAAGLLLIMASYAIVNTILSGPFEGDSSAEGAIGGMASQGFSASTNDIIKSAETTVKSYKYLLDVVDTYKDLMSDVNKSSLGGTNSYITSRPMVLQFLNSTKTKLQNLKFKTSAFSAMATKTEEITRYIDEQIDVIESMKNIAYVKGAKEFTKCDETYDYNLVPDWVPGDYEVNVDLPTNMSKEGCNQVLYLNSVEDDNLFKVWGDTKKRLTTMGGKDFSQLLLIAKEEFAGKTGSEKIAFDDTLGCGNGGKDKGVLATQYCVLKGVYEDLNGLETFKSTPIQNIYNSITEGEYSIIPSLATGVWDNSGDGVNFVVKTNPLIVSLIKSEDQLIKAIKDIKFVNIKLVASVVEGSAPLVVRFDVLTSTDPSSDAIKASQIEWDLNGSGLTSTANPTNDNDKGDNANFIDCYDGQNTPEVGFTNYCIYPNPGTFRAQARIKSSNDKVYASGVSAIDIKVQEPTVKIALNYKVGNEETERWVSKYYKDALVELKTTLPVTLDQANIKFNLTSPRDQENDTTALNKNQIQSVKWDFGDGNIESDNTITPTGKEHKYKAEGTYTVTIEITKFNGQTGRRIFNVVVGSPIAVFTVTPPATQSIGAEYKLGEEITLDASGSHSDIGDIKNYEWTIDITPDAGSVSTETPKPKGKVVKYKLKTAGKYKINLKVTDKADVSAESDTEDLTVSSTPPVPLFSFTVPNKNQPYRYVFDASKTYDTDWGMGDETDIEYQWTFTAPSSSESVPQEPAVIDPVEPQSLDSIKEFKTDNIKITVDFGMTGEYEVKLTAKNKGARGDDKAVSIKQPLTVDNILGVWWKSGDSSTQTLLQGKAEVAIKFYSKNANAYEVDFGDGEKETGTPTSGADGPPHPYRQAGKYTVKVTVYDANDNSNEIKKSIFIGNDAKPLAKIKIFKNGEEIMDFGSDLADISRSDVLTFDASDSKNTDGTGRDLKYSWKFGDSETSTKKTVSHKYKEIIPDGEAPYKVELVVYDKDDENKKSDPVNLPIYVISLKPSFSSLQVVPDSGATNLTTPVRVRADVFGAKDPDGQITQYKWWYYDENDPEEPLGMQITQSQTAFLVIGTKGTEGSKRTYKFGVEITDNENNKVQSEETEEAEGQLQPEMIPSLEVTNGPNKMPTASFSIDRTKVYAGDAVNFSSSSKDPDGKIEEYIWDFDGDGFFNDEPTKQSTISHVYEEKNLAGIRARLKVVDDKGAEAISEPVTVFIDSIAQAPKSAFKHQVVNGKTVSFTNNSTSDTKVGASIKEYIWDFDTASQYDGSDADGDGHKDNDIESKESNPTHTYEEFGIYQVKLVVKDDKGNRSEVINMVNVSAVGGAVGAFGTGTSTGTGSTGTLGGTQTGTGGTGTSTSTTTVNTGDLFGLGKDPVTSGTQTGTVSTQTGTVTAPTTGPNGLKALMTSNPAPSTNGLVILPGTKGEVTFDFSNSEGPIAYYIMDKNIYFDTNNDGIPNNDSDFKTSLPGKWTTNFDKTWGKDVVKLTVVDIDGNQSTTLQEVTF